LGKSKKKSLDTHTSQIWQDMPLDWTISRHSREHSFSILTDLDSRELGREIKYAV